MGYAIHKEKWSDVLGSFFKLILGQSIHRVHGWSGHRLRFVVSLWLILCIVLGTGYRSKLFSFLSNPEPLFVPPRTHKDLVFSDYKLFFRSYSGAAVTYVTTHNLLLSPPRGNGKEDDSRSFGSRVPQDGSSQGKIGLPRLFRSRELYNLCQRLALLLTDGESLHEE